VIIADDGLQHYRLARDVEIAIIDGARGLGNGWLLPAGPLREPPSRLASVHAVVVRGENTSGIGIAHHQMRLEPAALVNVKQHARAATLNQLQGLRVHAVAGIGNPQQFFDTLSRMGITHTPHAFPDHHRYTAADLAFDRCDAIVMTKKDAVKCSAFATEQHWALDVTTHADEALLDVILARLDKRN
jgi:tetraacyldisaccharide 4'-kinase